MDEQITKLLEKVNSYAEHIPQVYDTIKRQYAIEYIMDNVSVLLGMVIIGMFFYIALLGGSEWVESAETFYGGSTARYYRGVLEGEYDDYPERKHEIVTEYNESVEVYQRASRRFAKWIITFTVLCIIWVCLDCIWVYLTPDISFIKFLNKL